MFVLATSAAAELWRMFGYDLCLWRGSGYELGTIGARGGPIRARSLTSQSSVHDI